MDILPLLLPELDQDPQQQPYGSHSVRLQWRSSLTLPRNASIVEAYLDDSNERDWNVKRYRAEGSKCSQSLKPILALVGQLTCFCVQYAYGNASTMYL